MAWSVDFYSRYLNSSLGELNLSVIPQTPTEQKGLGLEVCLDLISRLFLSKSCISLHVSFEVF